MPACFTLTKIGENFPTSLIAVDNAICEHLGVTPSPKYYYHGWYDSIGFRLAIGKTFAEIRNDFRNGMSKPEGEHYYGLMLKILEYLIANYEPNAWHSAK